jgi:SAM-dependent methyltransferase
LSEQPTGWETAYQRGHARSREPHEQAEAVARLFRENGVRRILDLGCGDGRHLVWFAAQGFEMAGLDAAPTGLTLAEGFLAAAGQKADLVCADIAEIPFADGSFDAVICVQVINHQDIDGIRRTVADIRRVLRPEGRLFLTVATVEGELTDPKTVRLSPRLYTMRAGHEVGVPHYKATAEEWLAEFARFRIDRTWTDAKGKLALLAQKVE